ncbi:hypothetical protein Tco_0842495 [Tanacetum coccineum]|uniref:Uncharacterized protein n=1 Tax=Tanacetum coccineum TaxID=301880 RepID=A0ABQ5B0M4_9ASTR
MLDAAESSHSPSRSTSSPSPTPTSSPTPESTHTQPSPQPSPPQPSPTQPSPIHGNRTSPTQSQRAHADTNNNTKGKIDKGWSFLEADLTKTKKTTISAYTKLILRVKKLEAQIKVGKVQGDILGVHEKASTETELFIQEITPTKVIHEQEGSGKASDEISTAGKKKDTASEEVPPDSTAEVHISTAGETATYSRRSAEKRKDKEEEKKKAMDEAESTKKIDWNDPSVLRYHSLKMKPKSIAQARRNMIKY